MFTSSKPKFDLSHSNMFCNSNNSFIQNPSKEEIESCEGPLSLQECLFSLKNMRNLKSPGVDGFTVEFYQYFWNDIKFPLLRCLNESLDAGMFSMSQRQGLIK